MSDSRELDAAAMGLMKGQMMQMEERIKFLESQNAELIRMLAPIKVVETGNNATKEYVRPPSFTTGETFTLAELSRRCGIEE